MDTLVLPGLDINDHFIMTHVHHQFQLLSKHALNYTPLSLMSQKFWFRNFVKCCLYSGSTLIRTSIINETSLVWAFISVRYLTSELNKPLYCRQILDTAGWITISSRGSRPLALADTASVKSCSKGTLLCY